MNALRKVTVIQVDRALIGLALTLAGVWWLFGVWAAAALVICLGIGLLFLSTRIRCLSTGGGRSRLDEFQATHPICQD
jgi:hypothetical protein